MIFFLLSLLSVYSSVPSVSSFLFFLFTPPRMLFCKVDLTLALSSHAFDTHRVPLLLGLGLLYVSFPRIFFLVSS